MADKPIIMSGESVRAIMAGLKTQTRRVIKPQPLQGLGYMMGYEKKYVVQCGEDWPDDARDRVAIPYQSGDTLWVRETWAAFCVIDYSRGDILDSRAQVGIGYRADHKTGNLADTDGGYNFYPVEGDDKIAHARMLAESQSHKWRSPLYMPRWASRLSLLVTDVRAQRLQDISAADIEAEGITLEGNYRARFRDHWDRINARRGHPYSANDWVFAYTFEVKK